MTSFSRDHVNQIDHGKRVFWLGMHKVLKPTELKRLRDMGYEVFCPPYISPIYDQSADLTVDHSQSSTLPQEVFATLISHNFFYTKVPANIAEILNEFFYLVIVTINETWLESILDAFHGPIVYRTYGQHFSLSESLVNRGLWRKIIERDDFWIVPFADETLENEQRWLAERCLPAVPYQIPDDVFDTTISWNREEVRPEIAVSIPNIQNPYFAEEYGRFCGEFGQSFFRIYGPQRSKPNDNRIVGALDRQDFLHRIARSAGFLYNYTDRVCYLPPIEMMQLGGPVLYRLGSLLSRFFDDKGPGVYKDAIEAEEKLLQLLKKDKSFVAEVIDSQQPVRSRYDRSIVAPLFDQTFERLLGSPQRASHLSRIGPILAKASRSPMNTRPPVIAIPLHIGGLFEYQDGQAYAFEGIPRLIDVIIDTIVDETDARILISTKRNVEHIVYDFFKAHILAGRVSLYSLPNEIDVGFMEERKARLDLVKYIDSSESDIVVTLIPHYYLLPEFCFSSREKVLLLPDFFPHLAPDQVFDGTAERDHQHKRIGIKLAKQAQAILTYSSFTQSYLPAAGFVDPSRDDKVVVAHMPIFGRKRVHIVSSSHTEHLRELVGERPFLFYPTANRPNKRLDFCMELFARLLTHEPTLGLVLTCELGSWPAALATANRYDLYEKIVFLPRSSEATLNWLYTHARALVVTSTLEGNFPPQISEALLCNAPVVATRLATIVDKLGALSDDLLLCRPLDIDDFAEKLKIARDRREFVVSRQRRIVNLFQKMELDGSHGRDLALAFPQLTFRRNG